MTNHVQQLKAFEEQIHRGEQLKTLIAGLRDLRDAGISAPEVYSMLDKLRLSYVDTPIEDLILDVMDIVAGFCSVQNTIWPDSEQSDAPWK